MYNAYEGTRQPYLPQFAIGMTLSRLFIPLYVFGCPENFLTELLGNDVVSLGTCATLLCWLTFQLSVLELQVCLVCDCIRILVSTHMKIIF